MTYNNMTYNTVKEREKGSALILVIVAALVLSLVGIVSLTQTSTELSISRNFLADKNAFFAADTGINFGVNQLRDTVDPASVQFEMENGNYTFKSGGIADASPRFVEGFKAFKPPPPVGVSIEMGGDAGIQLTAWNLVVSSNYSVLDKNNARKEIQAVVTLLSSEY